MPFIDTRDLAPGHRLESALCIIGSGAAGSTVARALAGTRHRVIVLESGGLERDPERQDLNGGSIVGEPYFDLRTRLAHRPERSRERRAGRIVDLNGWPFSLTEVRLCAFVRLLVTKGNSGP